MGNQPGKDLSGSDRAAVTSETQRVSVQSSVPASHGQPREMSTSTGTYYSAPPTSSSNSAAVAPSSEVTWSTPPSTPQPSRPVVGSSQGQSSSSEVTWPGRASRRPEPAGHEQQGVYSVQSAALARPGSASLQSDSGSVSSHRRRFRVRDRETLDESIPSVTVRPGKKDKSLQRKSALNLPGPDGTDHRRRDTDPSSESSGGQSRTRASPLSQGGQHPLAKTTTVATTSTRHGGTKGGLFSLGKTTKKEPSKPSALSTLISQTAMLAPAVAQSHAVRDELAISKEMPPGAVYGCNCHVATSKI